MEHKKNIERGYKGSLNDLAEDIGNLHYESLKELLVAIADKLSDDANKDYQKKRIKLSYELSQASIEIVGASNSIKRAWEISKPFMEK
jgi:hypothetical protein